MSALLFNLASSNAALADTAHLSCLALPHLLQKAMGDDYVAGFLRQIDGEKDPRCLLLVFAMVPVRHVCAQRIGLALKAPNALLNPPSLSPLALPARGSQL